MKITNECDTVIDYEKARADYLSIQVNPALAEDVSAKCDCLIHRKRKYAKQADNSPWVGNNWFAWEHQGHNYSARYESTSTVTENILTLKERK